MTAGGLRQTLRLHAVESQVEDQPQEAGNQDFPLRGFVACDCCDNPLTACWSSGSHGRFPYYLCHKRGCEAYGKSICRSLIESEFAELLESMRPAENLIRLADACFRDIWNERLASSKDRSRSMETETGKLDHDIEQLMDRIVAADSDTLIAAYERRVRSLEEQRVKLRESAADCGRALPDYDATFRTAVEFLANPCDLWNSARLEDKRAVLKLTFAERLAYRRGSGFRTPLTSSPFTLLSGSDGVGGMMARPDGESLNELFSTLANWNACLSQLPPNALDDLGRVDKRDSQAG